MSDVTRILAAINKGESAATKELLPLVYDELRRLAAMKMAHEQPGHTLTPTALVHEAYLRLLGNPLPSAGAESGERNAAWHGRSHFLAAAAEAMRRILIDQARRKRSQRRGGSRQRCDLDHVEIAAPEPSCDVLAVHEALERFEQADPLKAQLVKLRYFAGLTIPEAADALGISVATAERYWSFARAWLHSELKPADPSPPR